MALTLSHFHNVEITLNKLSARLLEGHFAWDNFYNEPPVMKEILSYIKRAEDIPPACLSGLCRSVLRCRLRKRCQLFRRGQLGRETSLREILSAA